MQLSGGLPAANFNVLQFAAFAQDTWNAGPGFDVTIGVRYEREQLPQDEIVLDADWARRSGLLNNRIPRSRGKLSPRLGFVWDVQEQGNWSSGAAPGSTMTWSIPRSSRSSFRTAAPCGCGVASAS